jgi:hypothetical protein
MITELVFRFLSEDEPSNSRRSVVDLGWPGWRERFESQGGRKGPSTAACREALVKYMPGIEPLVDSLVDAAGSDEEMIPAARMVRIGWLEGLTQAWDFVSPPRCRSGPATARVRPGRSGGRRRGRLQSGVAAGNRQGFARALLRSEQAMA